MSLIHARRISVWFRVNKYGTKFVDLSNLLFKTKNPKSNESTKLLICESILKIIITFS